jgi:1-acyl-sn-glycerol-3-phosphate acyltransferase
MSVKNIEKHSAAYALLKHWVRFWHHQVFYRKVTYVNREKVPLDKHLIFTPNHQNALMDALAIELSFSNQFVFLARSDIFNNKLIASILYFLKLLPVYRIRDGYDTLKKNQEIFDKTMDIIHNKNGFVIFPEGNHAGYRRLRSLKKGFARIAFQAEEASDYLLDMKIIPVGINYNRYVNYRADLLVIFGEPLDVSAFYEAHKANPAVAYNLIKNRLAEKMKPLMIEIASENYELYHGLRKIYASKACQLLSLNPSHLYDRFKAEKKIIEIMENEEAEHPDDFPVYDASFQKYNQLLSKMGFSHDEQVGKGVSLIKMGMYSFALLVGLPLFMYGYINHIISYGVPVLVTNKIKDPQFHSSFKFVLTMILFPLTYLLQGVVVGLAFRPEWVLWAYLLSLPLSAAFAWNYARFFNWFRRQFNYRRHCNKYTSAFQEARALWSKIDHWMEPLLMKLQ